MNEPKGGWPCDRHEAHGGHDVPTDGVDCPLDCEHRNVKDIGCVEECPGVKAHPNTMIGRAG